MPTTFTKIASVSVGVLGSATMDFTSIPSTYTDLQLVLSHRTTEVVGPSAIGYKINGASTTAAYLNISGDGSAILNVSASPSSGGFARATRRSGQAADTTASTFGNTTLYFPNYTSTSNKSVSVDSVSENNGSLAYAEFSALLITSSAAINAISIGVYGSGGNWAQYSTATLYGINKS
jgi:hypothetical protein